MSECIECLLPDGKWNTVLDESGVCNYCRHWQANRALITDFSGNKELLQARLDKFRKRGRYDALVGFSGGKDSTYVAYSLKRRYGIEPLLVTFNNGFLNDYARENIRTTVDKLGLDHFFHELDWPVQQALYRSALEKYGDPCVACTVPLYHFSIKYAYDNRIPMVFHGRSPFQIFRNYCAESEDSFLELHETNYAPHSFERLLRVYRKLSRKLKQLLCELFPDDIALQNQVFDAVFFDADAADPYDIPDFIGLFQYEEYDEERIKVEMEDAVGYKRPKGDTLLGHGDCDLHGAIGHLWHSLYGNISTLTEISAMVRHGVIDKSEALRLRAEHEAAESRGGPGWSRPLCRATSLSETAVDEVIIELTANRPKRFANH